MPAIRGRRKRKAYAHEVCRINVDLDVDSAAKARRAADRLGVSLGIYLQAVVQRDLVDQTGLPLWSRWFYEEHPGYRPADEPPDDGPLPLSA